MQAPANTFSVGECLEYAWATFKQNIGDYVVAQLVLVIAYFASSAALSYTGRGGFALSFLLSSIFWTCSVSIAHAGIRKGKPKIEDAFRPIAERQGDYLMVCLAMCVGVIGCLVGIIASWVICFFSALLVLEGRDFKQAIIESKDLVLKYPGDVAILAIVVWALQFAGGLVCGIGIIFAMPIACLTLVKGYEQLSARLALELPVQPPPAEY